MNSNKILSSDVLDILFEKRNKAYGAYMLRKFYPNRVKTSLGIMLLLAAIFSGFTFLPEKKITPLVLLPDSDSIIVKTYEERILKEQPQPRAHSQLPVPTQKWLSRIEVVDSADKADDFHDLSNIAIGNTTMIDPPPGDGPGIIEVTGPGEAIPEAPAEKEVDLNVPVEHPDVQASFPGGDQELLKFLERNLRSPEDIDEGNAVQVKIKFVVGYDGNLQSFDVEKDGGKVFNEEVIRVLKKMPRWVPGKKNGRSVPVYHVLPVKFSAE